MEPALHAVARFPQAQRSRKRAQHGETVPEGTEYCHPNIAQALEYLPASRFRRELIKEISVGL